jgi:hypothetical protein
MAAENVSNQELIDDLVTRSTRPSGCDPKITEILNIKIAKLQKEGKLTDQQNAQLFIVGMGLSSTLDDAF